ncbi:recombinase family protein [Propionispira raffinosivorans]|uniref:recombinase family protein n=1 Tax=Propionispira raffinosivorans TaxID=86959 RepID=UPI0003602555|nr:recombinase family protein [Propionispira raffinosivorans]
MPDVKIIKGKRVYNASENSAFQEIIRVAAYCRVTTDDEEPLDSYNSQVRHYTDLIKAKSEWDIVEVYEPIGFRR